MKYILDGGLQIDEYRKSSEEVISDMSKDLKNKMSLVFYENGSPICVAQNEREVKTHIDELSASRYIGSHIELEIDTDYGTIDVKEINASGDSTYRKITYRSIGSLYDIVSSIVSDPEAYSKLMKS